MTLKSSTKSRGWTLALLGVPVKTRRLARWLSKTVRLTKRQRQQLIEALHVPLVRQPRRRPTTRPVSTPNLRIGAPAVLGLYEDRAAHKSLRGLSENRDPAGQDQAARPAGGISPRHGRWQTRAAVGGPPKGAPEYREAVDQNLDGAGLDAHTAPRWPRRSRRSVGAPECKGRQAERLLLGRLLRKRGEPSAKGSGRRLSEHQPDLMARARIGEAAPPRYCQGWPPRTFRRY